MKKLSLLLFVFSCVGCLWSQDYKKMIVQGDSSVEEIQAEADAYFEEVGKGRGTGYKQYRRWLETALLLMDSEGMLRSQNSYISTLEEYNNSLNQSANSLARTTTGTWEDLGPTFLNAAPNGYNPGVGRISAMDIDPSNVNHIIVGSPTGGVWRTEDGGANWAVLTDNLSNLDVLSLTIDPLVNTTYYWGSTGGAIYKSLDSGATWNQIGTAGFGWVNKILIDPTNTQKMYASVRFSGVYKSTNGGLSWVKINSNSSTGFDVEFKPGDTNIVYASGDAFFKSENGGSSFSQLSSPFSSGPKMIGVSESDSNVVYVLEASNGIFNEVYKSNNSGVTFSSVNTESKNYFGYASDGSDNLGQAPRDMDIVVSASNANHVFIAGINTWLSTDGGATFGITSQWVPDAAQFENIGYCHADVDILKYVNGELYVGSDGGIFKARDPLTVNANYYEDLTSGISNRQFYRIGVSQTDPAVVVGGSQDNGSSVFDSFGVWSDWWGADGGEGLVDKNNSDIIYGSTQFGLFVKSTDGGQSLFGVTQPDGKGGQDNWNFFSTPFEQDPIEQDGLYIAFDEVYKSTNGGVSWSSISPNYGANIDRLKLAPSDNNYLYKSIDDSFYYSTNGGANWIQSLNYSGGFINAIAVHPSDPQKVAIATGDSEKVYVSNDSGVNWTSYKFDIPNFAATSIVWDDNADNGLYVGMNYGVYYLDDTTNNSWLPFNNNLPNVLIFELEINYEEDKLYAATYGRGLWRSNTYDSSLSTKDFGLNNILLYPNATSNAFYLSWSKSDTVRIKIFNAEGKLMHYSKSVGINEPFKVDVSNYATGLYFVKVNTVNGEITKKLIVQ